MKTYTKGDTENLENYKTNHKGQVCTSRQVYQERWSVSGFSPRPGVGRERGRRRRGARGQEKDKRSEVMLKCGEELVGYYVVITYY